MCGMLNAGMDVSHGRLYFTERNGNCKLRNGMESVNCGICKTRNGVLRTAGICKTRNGICILRNAGLKHQEWSTEAVAVSQG